MAKIKKEHRDKLISLVREAYLKTRSYRETQEAVEAEFNVDLTVNTVKYWIKIAFTGEHLDKLKEEEAIMNRWRREANRDKPKPEETYAERLEQLFSGEITEVEFEALNGKDEANK